MNVELDETLLWSVALVFSALVGSVKANKEFNRQDSLCGQAVDITLGIICGTLVGHHFIQEFNTYVACLIALTGGAVGCLAIETIMQLIPNTARAIVKKWLNRI